MSKFVIDPNQTRENDSWNQQDLIRLQLLVEQGKPEVGRPNVMPQSSSGWRQLPPDEARSGRRIGDSTLTVHASCLFDFFGWWICDASAPVLPQVANSKATSLPVEEVMHGRAIPNAPSLALDDV